MKNKLITCPACKNYINAKNINLKENTLIYCYNCNTYINYKTNNYITSIDKEVNRGSHDKN